MKNAATQELFGYWQSLCHGRAAPERNQIDPAAIRGVLADTFMIEIDASPSGTLASIRLSGTRMDALFRSELKGLPFAVLWQRFDREAVAGLVRWVLDATTPIVAGGTGAPHGYPPLDLEMILLPLRHKGQTHARVLGALSPAAVPSWLGLVPVEPLALKSHRLIEVGPGRDGQHTVQTRPPVETHARRMTRRGHLMVLDGGRHRDPLNETGDGKRFLKPT